MKKNAQFYMANLGSEVQRIFRWKKLGDEKETKSAVERALKIIETLLSLPEVKGREGEVFILKDIISDYALPERKFKISENHLTSYFMPFALNVISRSLNNS